MKLLLKWNEVNPDKLSNNDRTLLWRPSDTKHAQEVDETSARQEQSQSRQAKQ